MWVDCGSSETGNSARRSSRHRFRVAIVDCARQRRIAHFGIRVTHWVRSTAYSARRYLVDRREFPVIEVIEALRPFAQPELLQTEEQDAALVSRRESNPEVETGAVVAQ